MTKKKTLEKDIEISPKTLVIGMVLVLVVMGFTGLIEYRNQSVIKDEQIQTMLEDHKKELEELKEKIDLVRFESEGEVENIKKKLASEEALREAIESQRNTEGIVAKQQISNLEKRLAQTDVSFDLTSIIKEWQPRVAYVECNFKQRGFPTYSQTNGSGVVFKFFNEPIKVLTNRHVILSTSLFDLTSCSVKLPGSDNKFTVLAQDIEVSASKYDWGTISINNPDSNLINLTSSSPQLCEQKPSLGDDIVVLGYPSIGSSNSVTATEGIVSGFDEDYFITSAKVEQGNSGGAAILLKNNCFLGIPTFASLGQVESLARILDIWTVVIKK